MCKTGQDKKEGKHYLTVSCGNIRSWATLALKLFFGMSFSCGGCDADEHHMDVSTAKFLSKLRRSIVGIPVPVKSALSLFGLCGHLRGFLSLESNLRKITTHYLIWPPRYIQLNCRRRQHLHTRGQVKQHRTGPCLCPASLRCDSLMGQEWRLPVTPHCLAGGNVLALIVWIIALKFNRGGNWSLGSISTT